MLSQRLRRWPSIKTTLGKSRFCFAVLWHKNKWHILCHSLANTTRWSNAALMSVQRLTLWPNVVRQRADVWCFWILWP